MVPSIGRKSTTTTNSNNSNNGHDNNHLSSKLPFGNSIITKDCNKRKRRPVGTPDPDAEVVRLAPETLLESERYVCDICNQGFQRDQNLQMHRRRHKVPWKLVKRGTVEVRKKVFVCPEPSCLHHNPCHALGDLVGIKKHFRRKHSNHKQWVCDRCSKAYAVQSDYKAHLKTCGTRGHSCDCGRVFSRVECFIEHQDTCKVTCHAPKELLSLESFSNQSRTTSRNTTNLSRGANTWPTLMIPQPPTSDRPLHNLELQLLPTSNSLYFMSSSSTSPSPTTTLKPIGGGDSEVQRIECNYNIGPQSNTSTSTIPSSGSEDGTTSTQLHLSIGRSDKVHTETNDEEESRLVVAMRVREKVMRQVEIAEEEFSNAKRIRQQAQSELNNAILMREQTVKQIKAMKLQVTCHSCQRQLN